MAFKLSQYFTSNDLKNIAAAVTAAEGHTSGEIVPVVVERSEKYETALWRGGFALNILIGCGLVLKYQLGTSWPSFSLMQILLGFVLTQGSGMLLVGLVPALRRFFAGPAALGRAVQQAAQAAFIAEEVFKTRERTGVLLFLSLFERRVVVLGDAGINAKVQQAEWDAVVQTIVAGMRTRQPAAGLLAAIEQCGGLLAKQGVTRRSDDADELANTLRLREDI